MRYRERSRLARACWAGAGILFVALGALGLFVPVLPTTPFLLLAAACALRGSRVLHRWLLTNRVFGEYLSRYRNHEGLPLGVKIGTISLLWAGLGASAFLAVPPRLWWVRVSLLVVGIGVTIHLITIPTAEKAERPPQCLRGRTGLHPDRAGRDAE